MFLIINIDIRKRPNLDLEDLCPFKYYKNPPEHFKPYYKLKKTEYKTIQDYF